MKGILFNTVNVQAILDDRKLATRRPIKINFEKVYKAACFCGTWNELYGKSLPGHLIEWYAKEKVKPLYQVGDILYVRETFCYEKNFNPDGVRNIHFNYPKFYYKADLIPELKDIAKWSPSIHMPREAARIFLEVTDVRAERLQDITIEQLAKEGFGNVNHPIDKPWYECARELFISTFLEIYPDCTEDSYVFAYEFKRIDKEVPNENL